MSQITWRNIDAPDFSQAGRLLEAGTKNISDAFTAGQNLIGQQQQIELANFENARKRNTADIQNQLLGFNTPEEMAAAQAQFTPEALKARFGAAYDQSQINQLVAERPGQLRQDLTSEIQLGNLQQAEASEPYEQQFYALLAQSPGQAANFLEQNKASFADTQKMYGDLANRQNQLDEMKFRRAQLADSAANRAEARASRETLQQEKTNLNKYGQELNKWVLDNPDKPIGGKAAELQKQFGINPVTGNQVATAVQGNIATLGAPTAEQSALLSSFDAKNQQANQQYIEDAKSDIKDKFLSAGIDTNLYSLQDDTKTSADDVIASLKTRLSDPNEAIEAYTRAKEVYPNASPAVIGYIVENTLSPATKWGFGDGATIDFEDVESKAQQVKDTANNAAAKKALTNALRLVDSTANNLLKEASAPLLQHQKNLFKSNIAGQQAPELTPVNPDYTGKRLELSKFVEDQLGKIK